MSEPLAGSSSSSDYELLELATVVLQSNGFDTRAVDLGDVAAVVAEDAICRVIVAAITTVAEVVKFEATLSGRLAELSGSGEMAKDLYSVLMTTQTPEPSQGQSLSAITYNLRYVRRIVRAGVNPTIAGVERALRPVLPFSGAELPNVFTDPLDQLRQRLIEDGSDPQVVEASIDRYLLTQDAQDRSDDGAQ